MKGPLFYYSSKVFHANLVHVSRLRITMNCEFQVQHKDGLRLINTIIQGEVSLFYSR